MSESISCASGGTCAVLGPQSGQFQRPGTGAPQRQLTSDDHVVRLEGFRSQQSDTLTVIGWNRHWLTLLVVPPETSPATHLTIAADRDNTDDSAQLLAAQGTAAERRQAKDDGVPLPA